MTPSGRATHGETVRFARILTFARRSLSFAGLAAAMDAGSYTGYAR